jgi:hypothetical protein
MTGLQGEKGADDDRRGARCALVVADWRVPAARSGQLARSTACSDVACDLPLSKTPERTILASEPAGIRRMSVESAVINIAGMSAKTARHIAEQIISGYLRLRTVSMGRLGLRAASQGRSPAGPSQFP